MRAEGWTVVGSGQAEAVGGGDVQGSGHAEEGEADLSGGGVGEGDGAFAEAGDGVAFADQRVGLLEGTGEGGEVGEAPLGEGGAVDDLEAGVAAGLDVAHQFEGETAHGVAGVDFDHGFQVVEAVGAVVDEGIDTEGAEEGGGGEAGFEGGDEACEAVLEGLGEGGGAGRVAEEIRDAGGRARGAIGSGGIGDELAARVGDESGVAEDVEAVGATFQLDGEVEHAFEPGFDDEGGAGGEAVADPAELGVEQIGFPEAEGVGAGEAEGFLDDDAVVAAGADAADGVEDGLEGVGGGAGGVGV